VDGSGLGLAIVREIAELHGALVRIGNNPSSTDPLRPGTLISVEFEALDTAQPTASAKQMSITRLAGLNEIHLGVLQGRLRDERDPEAQAIWAQWQADLWHYRVPGGERFDEFTDRVDATLQTLLQRHAGLDGDLVVVTHGLVIHSLLAHRVALAPGGALPARIANASPQQGYCFGAPPRALPDGSPKNRKNSESGRSSIRVSPFCSPCS